MYPIPRVPPVTIAFLPLTEKSSCMSDSLCLVSVFARTRWLAAECGSRFGAAGDVEDLTGHEGRFLGSEEGDCGRDVLGLANSANRDVGGEGFLELIEGDA